MNLKTLRNRGIALLLCGLMLFAFTACGPSEGEGDQPVKLEHVYGMENVELGDEIEYADRMVASDTHAFIQYYFYDEETYVSTQRVTAVDLATGEQTVVYELTDMYDEETQTSRGGYVNFMQPTDDGNLVIMFDEYFSDYSDPENYIEERGVYLVIVDMQGNELSRIDYTAQSEAEDSVYFYNVLIDAEGNLFAADGERIVIFDKDGNRIGQLDSPNYIENMLQLADGRIVAGL